MTPGECSFGRMAVLGYFFRTVLMSQDESRVPCLLVVFKQ